MDEKNDGKSKYFQMKNHTRSFYTIDDFPQFKILEENYEKILNEFLLVTEERRKKKMEYDLFQPWVEKNLYEESNEEGWDVAPLMIGGNIIEDRCKKFPILHELTSKIKGIVSISFSLLKPGTHIVPHKGYDDYSERVLRYHMGLIVPVGDVGIRVERDIKKWEEGKSFIFDDFLIHEAWNFSEKDRVVLIIDFLKEESDGTVFIDRNFNNSIKNYLKN
jgi:ornithine lipid ester-linked acyl 2-hydroxylase